MKLRYTCEFAGRGQAHPNKAAGVNSFWRHLRVQTQDGLNILEETDEYSSMCAMGWSYSSDIGENNNRSLNEGLVMSSNNQNNLFWAAQPSPDDGIVKANTAKKVQINQSIQSGVLNSSVLPNGAMGGLVMTLQTNNVMKSTKVGNQGGFSNAVEMRITSAVGDWNDASTAKNVDVKIKGTSNDTNNNTFVIGDRLWATDSTEAAAFAVGVVCSVSKDTSTPMLSVNGFNAASTNLAAALTATTTKVFVKQADRFTGYDTGANVPNVDDKVLAITEAAKKITWTLSNLEMNCELVSPPQDYIDGMIKKIKSKSGYQFNFRADTLKKVNIQGVNGLLTAHIPVGREGNRALSINVMPLTSTDTYDGDNLTATSTDYAEEYQWTINNQQVPDQRCALTKLSQTPPKCQQLALQELRKSLVNKSIVVRNLQRPENNFVIGRAFSAFGHTSNIRKSDLSLRVLYGSSATIQKVFNCYICSQRTLVIRENEMEVVD